MFQSLIEILEFSDPTSVTQGIEQAIAFQSLIGIMEFSDCRGLKALIYVVFKVGLRKFRANVPFQKSTCQMVILKNALKLLAHKGYRACVNL